METTNNTGVMPDPVRAYADETIALLNHVEAVEDEIGALIGDTDRTRNALIADRHREIGTALKLAEIYSTLAIAEAVDTLRAALTSTDPIQRGREISRDLSAFERAGGRR